MFGVNRQNGLAAIAKEVNKNFNVKTFTKQMLDAILHPNMANLSITVEAYRYFNAMVNGKSFITSSGQAIDFGNVDPAAAKKLLDLATTALKDYDTVNVPYDSKGDVTPLLNADGSHTNLLQLIENPSSSYHVDFVTGDFSINSPDWAKNMSTDYQKEDDHWWGRTTATGGTDQFQVGDLNARVSGGDCTHYHTLNWDLSGTGAQWAKAGALHPTTADTAKANADANSLENYLASKF
jgi:hypothetical protein